MITIGGIMSLRNIIKKIVFLGSVCNITLIDGGDFPYDKHVEVVGRNCYLDMNKFNKPRAEVYDVYDNEICQSSHYLIKDNNIIVKDDSSFTLIWRKVSPASDFEIRKYYGMRLDTPLYSVSKYFGKEKEVVIPSRIEGKVISRIDECAFRNTLISSISIPASCYSIGDYAFEGCINLKTFKIHQTFNRYSNLSSIGIRAFADCIRLNHIDIDAPIRNIAPGAFSGCIQLEEISIYSPFFRKYVGWYSGCSASVTIIDE